MKKTLLIVEDNLILCDILERWLQKAGYRVLTAIDEPSARRKIKGNNVALVLTDVRLPEGDGISLLEWSISQGLHIPFVAVNCGCIRGELAASEFFGHVQGAFTDAKKDTAGYFETAKGGTLFLDEIGNMPPEMQTLLLRVLQERVYCPVGSRKELEADVRILSATNEDMERAIREGRFREDLYYRLAEFEIRQPSLSECPEDILPLADFFREQHSEEIRVETSGFTEQAKISMLSHSWPGNVRELDNRIRRAVLLAVSPLLTHKDLNLNATICRTGEKCKKGLMEEAEEKELIRKILEECGGKISRVARMLGMSRPTLYKKMERYGLR